MVTPTDLATGVFAASLILTPVGLVACTSSVDQPGYDPIYQETTATAVTTAGQGVSTGGMTGTTGLAVSNTTASNGSVGSTGGATTGVGFTATVTGTSGAIDTSATGTTGLSTGTGALTTGTTPTVGSVGGTSDTSSTTGQATSATSATSNTSTTGADTTGGVGGTGGSDDSTTASVTNTVSNAVTTNAVTTNTVTTNTVTTATATTSTSTTGGGSTDVCRVMLGDVPVCCTPQGTDRTEADEVLELLNAYRNSLGLSSLARDPALEETIQGHCMHMDQADFFDHYSPVEELYTPWDRAELCGTSANAENIAAGQNSPSSVMDAWRNSSGHDQNMRGNFQRVGIGRYAEYWGQIFGG